MTSTYILSRGAADDLRAITRYTLREWGAEQCRSYVHQIEGVATELALGRGLYRTLDELYPGIRVKRAGHHYVFCLPRTSEPALIVAILHERMDLIARLKDRLE